MCFVSGGVCFVLVGKSGQYVLDDCVVYVVLVICIDLKIVVFYSDESICLIFMNIVFVFCFSVCFLKIDMFFFGCFYKFSKIMRKRVV